MIKRHPDQAFTLVELILVMALLATLLAFAAPSLSRSFHGRNLGQEATRFVALTENARGEAVSEGVPMVVWIDVESGRFGFEARSGYAEADLPHKEFALNADTHFEFERANQSGATTQQGVSIVEFSPDGTPDLSGVESVRLADRFGEGISVVRTTDGWGYEILKETK